MHFYEWYFFSLFSKVLEQARHIDEKVRVNQRQCKAGDTVRSNIGKPRGSSTSDKNKFNQ